MSEFKETPAYDAAVEACGGDPTRREPKVELTKRQRYDINKRAQEITDEVWERINRA